MSETEFGKLIQVILATWGLFGLALLFAPGRVLETLTRGRVLFSRGTLLFLRLVGALSVLGACSRLFIWHG
ncbi:MAG TPA: hypothetical protein VKS44_08135 [Candidatus Acidoferrales bacterium]|nr:hypothetical protein [Candidatus Acidoferrales bacterium]